MTIKDEQGADRPQFAQDETVPPDLARRRFAKSGMAVSGVLMTLAAQPVLGAQVCTAPSVSASANLSRHGTTVQTCNGQTPAFWSASDWTQLGITTKQTALFDGLNGEFGGARYTGMTLIGVVSSSPLTLGSYMVAALLNTRSGRTPFLTEGAIKNMYSELLTGPFHPTAGVSWDEGQVILYLQGTQA